jgi:hypothetical protein
MVRRTSLALATLVLLLASGCTSPTASDDSSRAPVLPDPVSTSVVPTPDPGTVALLDRSNRVEIGNYSEAELDSIGAMPLGIFQAHALWTPGGSATIAAVKQRNPDFLAIGILNVLTLPEVWGQDHWDDRFPMVATIYDLIHTRTFLTTEGEECWTWPGARMISPMRYGVLDETMLQDYLDIVSATALQYPGVVDGIFFDYTSGQPWPYPIDGPVVGAPDMDGDGIPFDEDEAEQFTWVEWQRRLMVDLQARFGEGLILIANGRLPLDRPEIRPLLAGVWFEAFPDLVWNWGPKRALEMALEINEPGGLVPRRGRTWSVYGPRSNTQLSDIDFRRWASMLTGDLYHTIGGTETIFPPPDFGGMELGAAVGPVERFESPDGSVSYRRFLEFGQVEVRFDATGLLVREESGAERTAP